MKKLTKNSTAFLLSLMTVSSVLMPTIINASALNFSPETESLNPTERFIPSSSKNYTTIQFPHRFDNTTSLYGSHYSNSSILFYFKFLRTDRNEYTDFYHIYIGPENVYDWVGYGKTNKSYTVKTLQLSLNKLIGANLVVDGQFGPATYNAIVSYQKSKGLSADGVCGKNTWLNINYDLP